MFTAARRSPLWIRVRKSISYLMIAQILTPPPSSFGDAEQERPLDLRP